jgi:hypothetical protein
VDALDLIISGVGGAAPVEGSGWICGKLFHFSARGSGWTLDVTDGPDFQIVWTYGEPYGRAFDASYMDVVTALRLIQIAAERYVEEQTRPAAP